MTHTPGPWRIGERYGDNLPIVDAGGSLVALADCSDKANHADKVDADAKLIAAAPNLLQALRLAESTLKRLRPHDGVTGTLDVIRIAIKEATGT